MCTKGRNFEKVLLITMMLLPTLIVSINLDNDFWFLFNHGEYIVNHGFPHIEPFTIHSDFSFIVQQWLVSVVFYYLYHCFGEAGVIVIVCLVSVILAFLLYTLCMLISNKKFYLSVLITTYVYLLLCLWFMVSRPQVFTYIIVLCELICLEKYAKNSSWWVVLILPVLSLMLINLHSSMWCLLFVFVLPYLVETIKINKIRLFVGEIKAVPLIVATVIMALVGFVNPYGYKAVTYIFGSYGNEEINSSIQEMSAPDVKSLNGAIFFGTLLFVCLTYIINRTGKTKPRYILLTLGTTLMALMSLKSIPYFLFGSVIPLAYFLENCEERIVFSKSSNNQRRSEILVLMFLLVICVTSVFIKINEYERLDSFPSTKNAIEYLNSEENKENFVVYTGFADGAYAEKFGLKCYIDARAEVFLKRNNGKFDVFSEYISLQKGDIHYKDFLEKYNFSHIIVTDTDILETYLSKDEEYIVYYEDDASKIYTQK